VLPLIYGQIVRFDGLYFWNQKAQTAEIESFCCQSWSRTNCLQEIAHIALHVEGSRPHKIRKKSEFQELGRVWWSLGVNLSRILAWGWYMF